MGKIVAINISKKRGVVKAPIEEGKLVEGFGIEGDAHGGDWHRQISLLAQESIDKMKALGIEDLTSGKFAENITTEGIELHSLPVGTRLLAGDCELEVTQIGKECHQHCEIYRKVGMCIMPTEGIFARIIRGGTLREGDGITIA